ncbi:zinc finger protein 706-like [Rhopilema esculentum]|uniref:zinc finger protein 706-like n=1 Tax=Rhopilema esculentum TaxID=499914 RepID=UPI0031D77808
MKVEASSLPSFVAHTGDVLDIFHTMARGQQKIQSQQKNAEKRAKSKKGTSQIKSAGAALVHSCPVCKSQMPDPKTYKQHFESKHPKVDLPEELKSV